MPSRGGAALWLWVCILLLAGLSAALLASHVVPMVIDVRTPGTVPDLPAPTTEHHWSLDEKLASWRQTTAGTAANAQKPLFLTAAEANAWLARQTPVPAAGFSWIRARLAAGPSHFDLVVHGSGWWQRALTLVVRANAVPGGHSGQTLLLDTIRLNSLDLHSGWRRRLGVAFLRALFAANWPLSIDDQGTLTTVITVDPTGGFIVTVPPRAAPAEQHDSSKDEENEP
jgi:hypothetical protein